ncbi:hypothetical protein BS50DRAFT_297976 [Corynespora cassiicola Philippines]|uniref:Uncharacterized protein n=1 Tax=Corynespora cassiicola Philippines TaxID=1448308 RepID=A0A2T2NWS4_CORCC|nr:hypothetical protein BS50DRAFT_297976 [Corynespora cassiicola Philippines]
MADIPTYTIVQPPGLNSTLNARPVYPAPIAICTVACFVTLCIAVVLYQKKPKHQFMSDYPDDIDGLHNTDAPSYDGQTFISDSKTGHKYPDPQGPDIDGSSRNEKDESSLSSGNSSNQANASSNQANASSDFSSEERRRRRYQTWEGELVSFSNGPTAVSRRFRTVPKITVGPVASSQSTDNMGYGDINRDGFRPLELDNYYGGSFVPDELDYKTIAGDPY